MSGITGTASTAGLGQVFVDAACTVQVDGSARSHSWTRCTLECFLSNASTCSRFAELLQRLKAPKLSPCLPRTDMAPMNAQHQSRHPSDAGRDGKSQLPPRSPAAHAECEPVECRCPAGAEATESKAVDPHECRLKWHRGYPYSAAPREAALKPRIITMSKRLSMSVKSDM